MKFKRCLKSFLLFSLLATQLSCGKKSDGGGTPEPPVNPPTNPPTATNDIDWWMTLGNQTNLLQKQTTVLSFGTTSNNSQFIDVDSATAYQSVDGFGYTLTGGSAMLIHQMPDAQRAALLGELFGSGDNSIKVSYIRISIGASDLDASVFSYNGLAAGETDETLAKFSISQDRVHLIPILKEILALNPSIKILATPWSAPTWMKDNGNTVGGNLKTEYYDVYAQYFVKYIQEMKKENITIDAVTPQNEPLNPNNNPSMSMSPEAQRDFIKNNLGPAFAAASITTKIIVYDHNCDRTDYPLTILNDAAAKAFVDGSAFHLYAGNINSMSDVHNAHSDKNIYFTEQYTASNGDFGGDLKWHLKNVIIGSMRNWSRIALEWNLANDPTFNPHTPGGCTECKGALTISGSTITRNVAYYIVGHISKFVPPGSTRIASTQSGNLNTVAFKRADGKKVLIVENDGGNTEAFNLRYKQRWVLITIPAGAVATYVW